MELEWEKNRGLQQHFEDCYMGFDGGRLTVGNALLERVLDVTSGHPHTVALTNKMGGGDQWVSGGAPLFTIPWLPARADRIVAEAFTDDDLGIAKPHLRIHLTLIYEERMLVLRVVIRIYPQTAWLREELQVKRLAAGEPFQGRQIWPELQAAYGEDVAREATETANKESKRSEDGGKVSEEHQRSEVGGRASGEQQRSEAGGLQTTGQAVHHRGGATVSGEDEAEATTQAPGLWRLDDNNSLQAAGEGEVLDVLALRALHCRWRSVTLRDRTDTANNLVSEEAGLLYGNENRGLRGNLMMLEKTLVPSGLLVIKESPPMPAQLHDRERDFHFQGKTLQIIGGGLDEEEVETERFLPFYGTALGVYDGSEYARMSLMRDYHASIRRHCAQRDSFLMSNTWGDRSRDGRVNEAFLLAEIQAAAALGITHVQIDDGWQKGTTSNSVLTGGRWGDYHSQGDGFWQVHPERFPRGLEPVVDSARAAGVELGLWFSPDSSGGFRHWREDAEEIISLNRRYSIRYFKLDGIQNSSKAAEENLVAMMQTVIRVSGGEVYFNLDTTAEIRLGYLGRVQYGGFFLENRYTDWGNYYPHWTFRNLWQLAPYVPAQKLQMEFLNTSRNLAVYSEDDPLAPARCGVVYAFLVTFFANPLAWMELSSLPPAVAADLAACIRLAGPVHREIASGHIVPLGDEPSGTGWSGLQSLTGEDGGYLLIVREYNSDPVRRLTLWQGQGRALRLTPVVAVEAGALRVPDGQKPLLLEPDSNGAYAFQLAKPFSAALWRYEWSPLGQSLGMWG